MTKKVIKNLLQYSFVVTVLAVFPGCNPLNSLKNMFKGGSKTTTSTMPNKFSGDVLVSIDGKPVLTADSFEKKLIQKLQSHPQTASIPVASIPMAAKRQFLNELVRLSLISEVWGKKNKVELSPEFAKNLAEKMELLKESLVVEAFVNELKAGITVTDAEVKDDYAKNKEKYVKVAGGVLVSGINFDKKESALAFYDKVKSVPAQFNAMAKKEKGGKYKEFGRISEPMTQEQFSMQVPADVRASALGEGKTPRVGFAFGKDGNWVIYVSDKKDSVYYELSEITNDLKAMIEANKFRDELEKRIKVIQDDANVVINEEFFKDKSGLPDGAKVLNAEEVAKRDAAEAAEDAAQGADEVAFVEEVEADEDLQK